MQQQRQVSRAVCGGADIAVNDESVAEVKSTLEKSKELKPLSENTKELHGC